jgi:hypothetical protein
MVLAAVTGLVVAGASSERAAVDGRASMAVLEPLPGTDTPPPLVETPSTDEPPEDTVVVWTRSRLPEGYADAVAGDPGFAHVSLVRAGIQRLVRTEAADGTVVEELPEGWWHPVEVLAFDPDTYDDLVDRPVVGPLDVGEALLSRSSAEVRGVGAGGNLVFADGTELRVAAVVSDELVGAGEVIVRADGAWAPDRERYLLVRPDEDLVRPAGTEARLRGLLPEERALGVRAHGATPVLRHSAGVTAPARMKVHFGEFALRHEGRALQPGYSWVEEHITVEQVPILGRIECHRDLFPPLRAALQELIDRGAADTIDPGEYGGCWVARTQGGEDAILSSHAWGVSIDLNVAGNHLGTPSSQDPLLLEVMARHGFAWGGDWLLPDPMHFELVPDRRIEGGDRTD